MFHGTHLELNSSKVGKPRATRKFVFNISTIVWITQFCDQRHNEKTKPRIKQFNTNT